MKNLKILICSLFIVTSCNAQNNQVLEVNDFANAIKDKNIQLLDVRTKEEFGNGHIVGSLQADWTNKAEFKVRSESLNKSKSVYVYCLSGGRSASAAKQLRSEGFTVFELKGGITAWNYEKQPLEGLSTEKGMSKAEFQKLIANEEIVLVDFGAKWCPPCVKMNPILAMFSKHMPNVKIVKIDADKDKELCETFRIKTLPTLHLYKKGKKVKEHEGFMDMGGLHEFAN